MATSNNEWHQIYQNNLNTGPSQHVRMGWSGDVVTDATIVTTTTTTASSSSVGNRFGRAIRPKNTRRRSRASRRTPTTLLNTDTTNFRAMVQQFTGGGGGSGAFVSAPTTLHSYNTNQSGIGYYGTGSRITQPASSGYNVEIRQPQDQQYYTMVASSGGAGGDHQQGFVQRIQEGGMANFSDENITNGGNNSTCMF